MTIEILQKSDIDHSIKKQVTNLFKQLNANMEQLALEMVLDTSHQITFACCKDDDTIVGIALMAEYYVISGHKGWIEDVVVDHDHRRKGIGKKLIERLIYEGKKKKLNEILLFSNDKRIPAITLYKSLGFNVKESRIYQLKLN